MYTPQRLFGEVGSSSDILNHEPFLERARLQREQERDGSARLALGAYVVARLINRLLTLEESPEALDGFRWQLEAVRRHVNDLPADAPESAHLSGVAAAVSADGRTGPGLWMNLTAYAYFLEHEGRLDESLEILSLASRVQGRETSTEDFAAYALFAARLNRQLARWDTASSCYRAAEEAALACGDNLVALRGRLGQGAVHRGQGNYPLARAVAEDVVREAATLGITEAQALAYADLGAIYAFQGLRLEAMDAKYQAFRLASEMPQQMRALGDLAISLSEIGAFEAARLAFQIVIESRASLEVRANSTLELMDLESSVGNRVAFERQRAAAETFRSRMSPRMSVDYLYKLGVGLSRFGQASRGQTFLKSALELAEQHQLNDWYFKIETTIAELAERKQAESELRLASELSDSPAVRQVELGLREYALAET